MALVGIYPGGVAMLLSLKNKELKKKLNDNDFTTII